MSTRKTISKKTRFLIFARDKFACQYCGRKAGEAVLVIDHLIPVAKGGANHEPNLITSCEDCNQGKGARSVDYQIPESVKASVVKGHQEQMDQLRLAEMACGAERIKESIKQDIINKICDLLGEDSCRKSTASLLYSFSQVHGLETVFEWMEIAAKVSRKETRFCKYVCGIRKNRINANGGADTE